MWCANLSRDPAFSSVGYILRGGIAGSYGIYLGVELLGHYFKSYFLAIAMCLFFQLNLKKYTISIMIYKNFFVCLLLFFLVFSHFISIT